MTRLRLLSLRVSVVRQKACGEPGPDADPQFLRRSGRIRRVGVEGHRHDRAHVVKHDDRHLPHGRRPEMRCIRFQCLANPFKIPVPELLAPTGAVGAALQEG